MQIPTPEEFEAIKEFGVDFFKQVANVDINVTQPSTGLGRNSSNEFKHNLLVAEQMVKQTHQPPQQVPHFPQHVPYFPPEVPHYQPIGDPVQVIPQPQIHMVPNPVNHTPKLAETNNGQLEFNLTPDGQEITNKLLKEISIKLTKILDLLSSNKNVTKLNVEPTRVQKAPNEFKKTQ